MMFVSFKNLNLHNWFMMYMHVEVIPKQLVDGMESLDYHENMDSENDQHTPQRSNHQLSYCLLLCINYRWIIWFEIIKVQVGAIFMVTFVI